MLSHEGEVISLYCVQSIELCTEYSGIIHKEENRISTDVRAATDEESRTQIIHQTTKAMQWLHVTPCRKRRKQFKYGSNRTDC
jgi:hypothetical protein